MASGHGRARDLEIALEAIHRFVVLRREGGVVREATWPTLVVDDTQRHGYSNPNPNRSPETHLPTLVVDDTQRAVGLALCHEILCLRSNTQTLVQILHRLACA